MAPYINIKVLYVDKVLGSLEYRLSVSNGQTSTSIDFYGQQEEFQRFGDSLTGFPKNLEDRISLRIGEEGNRWAYFILLEVFCFESNGESAMKVIIERQGEEPYYQKCEFYLVAEPASFNRLGDNLKRWNPVEQQEFEWTAKDR